MNKTVFIIVCIVSAVIIVALGVSLILLATNSDNSPIDNTVRYDVNIANNETYGSVSGSGEYAENEKVELWASANKGYVFYGWYRDGQYVSFENKYEFTMPAQAVNLNAVYSEDLPAPEYLALLAGNLYAFDYTKLSENTDIQAADIAPLVEGITLGQILMTGKKLPVDVTQREDFKTMYNISLSGLLLEDQTTMNQIKSCNIGIFAEVLFADAMYKNTAFKNSIAALYDIPVSVMFDGDVVSMGVELISALGTLKMQDIFDGYVENPGTISYYEVYKVMGPLKVSSVLGSSLSDDVNDRIKALTLSDIAEFYFALKQEEYPDYENFDSLMTAFGSLTVGEIMAEIDVTLDQLTDIITNVIKFINKPFTEIIEESVYVPDFIKNTSWYQELSQMTIANIIQKLYENSPDENKNYIFLDILEILPLITSVTQDDMTQNEDFFNTLKGETIYSLFMSAVKNSLPE